MSEVRSGNSPSSSDDFYGKRQFAHGSPTASPTLTLADMLRAAIAGKVDPKLVFNALPTNFTTMIDEASRHAASVGFLELPMEAQRTLFASILEATSGKNPPTSAKAQSEKRPWWKFW